MESFVAGMWTILCAIVLPVLAAKYLSLCVTTVREGEGKLVELFGKFKRSIMTYEGCGFDDDWNIVNEPEATRGGPGIFGTGLHWVGLWPFYRLHWYDFRWTVLREKEGGGNTIDMELLTRAERMSHFLVNSATYVIRVPDIEIGGNMKITAVLVVIGRIANPYIAFYRVKDWLRATTEIVQTSFRDWATNKTFETINRRKEDGDEKFLVDLNSKEISNRFGFEIEAVRIYDLIPDEESRIALNKVVQAQRAADARREEARGIRDARTTTADGEAAAKRTIAAAEQERARLLASTPGGLELAGYDALTAAAQGAGNTVPFPVNIASHLLRDLGRGVGEAISGASKPPTPTTPSTTPQTTETTGASPSVLVVPPTKALVPQPPTPPPAQRPKGRK